MNLILLTKEEGNEQLHLVPLTESKTASTIKLEKKDLVRRFMCLSETSVIFNDIKQDSHVLCVVDANSKKPDVVFTNESEIVTFNVRVQ